MFTLFSCVYVSTQNNNKNIMRIMMKNLYFMSKLSTFCRSFCKKRDNNDISFSKINFGNASGIVDANIFKKSISELLSRKKYPDIALGLLEILVNKGTNSIERNNYLQSKGIRRISDLKEYTLDIIIDYSLLLLEDDVLTEEEVNNIRLLKIYLGIEDGDFYRNGKQKDVKQILTTQLSKLYADNIIDAKEVLMKGDLQALYGLSFDEFEAIVKEIAKEAIERGAEVKNLDTFL